MADELDGTTHVMTGNEAIARGAVEAGVAVATSYPGTPATEILATLAKVSAQQGITVQWSANEKVAFEVALGASYAGARVLCSMKHLGENTIIDSLNVATYTGTVGGLVLVVADDPGPTASQNELDSRNHAACAGIPCIEPVDGQEAKDMIVEAFRLSERFELPVQVRVTRRISHTNWLVKLGPGLPPARGKGFAQDKQRFVLIPSRSRVLRRKLLAKEIAMAKAFETFPFNRIEGEQADLGIVACGLSYNTVREALRMASLDAVVLKLATTFPVPEALILDLMKRCRDILVVEELDPLVEERVKLIALESGFRGRIMGCGEEFRRKTGELTTEKVLESLLDAASQPKPAGQAAPFDVPARIPALCAGCPHRCSYYAIREAFKECGYLVFGDRGCYNVGSHPPLSAIDTCLCMGASISIAEGARIGGEGRTVVAVIGDSTFLHAGLQSLMNSAFHGSRVVVAILDNEWTSMTGHQPNPRTGITADGRTRPQIDLTKVVQALGCERVYHCDPYAISESIETLKQAGQGEGTSVVILSRLCALKAFPGSRRGACVQVDASLCVGCGICVNAFGCPSMHWTGDRMEIDVTSCVGCASCLEICPAGAILKGTDDPSSGVR